MDKLAIVYQPIGALKLRAGNPRTHTQKQIRQIATSIEQFGFTNPVLVDDDNVIIAGHGRREAAALLNQSEVPTIRLSNMTEAQIRTYVIADNRLAELAGWDRTLLGLELQYISELDVTLDPTLTGFELPEIDILIDELSLSNADDPADDMPEAISGPPVTRLGDIWQIGKHRLICGDATNAETYRALLDEEKAQMIFTDPPYNVRIGGHVSGLGKLQHREFAMASGEMSKAEFVAFLTTISSHLVANSIDGAIHFQCIDWRHAGEMQIAGEAIYSEHKNTCVWAKTNAGMGSLYRSQHELVFVFKSGSAPHINNIELGRHGRYRTNVWSYAGINSFGKDRDDLKLHPTVKPVALVADAIKDCSHRRGLVLDAFAGSGTTLIAADQTARRGYGIEIDPAFCDVVIRRMAAVCGLQSSLLVTGETFEEVAAARAASRELSN